MVSFWGYYQEMSEQIDPSPRRETRIYDNGWMEQGNCVDKPPGMFFPSDGVGVEIARRVCADCVVKEECLDYALSNRIDHGVWGGASERERRRMIKAQNLAK